MAGTLDILSLSNAFRKNTPEVNGVFATNMVQLGAKLTAISTNYVGPEIAEPIFADYLRDVESDLVETLRLMAMFAKPEGYDAIVLPLNEGNQWSRDIQKYILDPVEKEFNVAFKLAQGTFKPDYSDVNEDVRTCLDEGLRGMGGVAPPWEVEVPHVR